MAGKQNDDNSELEVRIGMHLRAQVDELPDEVGRRLLLARRSAVCEMPEERFRQGFPDSLSGWPVVAPIAVSAAVVALFVNAVFVGRESIPEFPALDVSEVSAAQEVELLQDLEFLAWLENEGVAEEEGEEDFEAG